MSELTPMQARNLLASVHDKGNFLSVNRDMLEEAARRGDKTVELEGKSYSLTYRDDQVRFNPIEGYLPCGWIDYKKG